MGHQLPTSTPGSRSGFSIGQVLAIVMLCGGAVIGGSAVLRGQQRPVVEKGPVPLPGWGFPRRIRVAKDGWETLVMREMGMQLEVPPTGRITDFNFDTWSPVSVANLETYAGSRFPMKNEELCEMVAYVYRSNTTYKAEDFPKRRLQRLQSDPDSKDVTFKSKKVVIDGVQGLQCDVSYTWKKKAYLDRSVYFFGRRSVRNISNAYPKSMRKKGEADFARIVSSLKFIPNLERTFWATDPKLRGSTNTY